MTNVEKIKAISTPVEEDWLIIAQKWEEEDLYLEKSTRIAVSVLRALKANNMTKQELAEKMGVSAQYISKIVKGNENLTLETISKLENALGVKLIDIIDLTYIVDADEAETDKASIWDKLVSAKSSAGVGLQGALTYALFSTQQAGEVEVALS